MKKLLNNHIENENPADDRPVRKKKHGWIVLVAIVLVIGLIAALLPGRHPAGSSVEVVEQVLQAAAETGRLETVLLSGGSLSTGKSESVTLAGSVKLTGWAVQNGERVSEGQLLATVDKNSVISAISDINDMLTKLDKDLEAARSDTVSSKITAPVAGRIAAVFAEKGESVTDVMYEHGALMLLSLDGRLAVSVEQGGLTTGTTLNVELDDGSRLQGTVSSASDGVAVVTVRDDEASYLDHVTVRDETGTVLGEGELTVHSGVKITGFNGTVSALYAAAGRSVSAGQTLITLTDTSYAGEYESLLADREKLISQLDALFAAYENGGVYADADGVVDQINKDLVKEARKTARSSETAAMTVVTLRAQSREAAAAAKPSPVRGTASAVPLRAVHSPMQSTAYAAVLEAPGGGETGGSPEGGKETEDSTTTSYGRITAIDLASMTMTIALFSGEERVLTIADLASLDLMTLAAAKVGDLVALECDSETGALKSLTLYQAAGSESGGFNGWGGFGGFSFGGKAAEEEKPDYTMAETELCTLNSERDVTISLSVDELDIRRLAVGISAEISLDAVPGKTFEGVITEIDPNGTNSGGNTKFAVEVTMERTEQMIGGMNASLRIPLGGEDGLLLLPCEAVCEDESGTYVFTGYDEKEDSLLDRVDVTIGRSDGMKVEITSGLAEGDTVYYRYADSIKYNFTNR